MSHTSDIESSKHFYCFICREQKPVDTAYKLYCGHAFCYECLLSYIESRLGNNKIKIKCFYPVVSNKKTSTSNVNVPCGIELNSEEIIDILSISTVNTKLLAKYKRLKYLAEHPKTTRSCPQCDTIVHRTKGMDTNVMQCTNCHLIFCFEHGQAHQFEYENCSAYNKRVASETRASNRVISKISKKCPGCQADVEKSGGCNHMKCEVCDTAFCWLCGKEVSDSIFPAHFQWWNPVGCVNMQMHEDIEPSFTTIASARLLATLQFFILGPLCAICTLLTMMCFGWYFYTASMQTAYFNGERPTLGQVSSFCMSMWGMFWMGILVFLPLACFVIVLLVLLYPFYAMYKLFQCEIPIPEFLIGYFPCCWCLLGDDVIPGSMNNYGLVGGTDSNQSPKDENKDDIESNYPHTTPNSDDEVDSESILILNSRNEAIHSDDDSNISEQLHKSMHDVSAVMGLDAMRMLLQAPRPDAASRTQFQRHQHKKHDGLDSDSDSSPIATSRRGISGKPSNNKSQQRLRPHPNTRRVRDPPRTVHMPVDRSHRADMVAGDKTVQKKVKLQRDGSKKKVSSANVNNQYMNSPTHSNRTSVAPNGIQKSMPDDRETVRSFSSKPNSQPSASATRTNKHRKNEKTALVTTLNPVHIGYEGDHDSTVHSPGSV